MTDTKEEQILTVEVGVTDVSDDPMEGCEGEEPIDPEKGERRQHNHEDVVEVEAAVSINLGRFANLTEGRKIARKGLSLKRRRRQEADSGQYPTIDPKQVGFHPRFKGLLGIDEELAESISADMAMEGYYLSKPIVLATWPGLEGLVLIDGHTRLQAAIRAGEEKIPYVVETFSDINGALEYVAKVQTHRRPTDDWVRYQLIIEIDSPMERGGDRRSEQAKSKGSQGPIETKYANSAERTAALVGCSPRKVKRARRIRKDGTSEILEALRNREMTISQAEQAIIKKAQAEAENNTGEQSSGAESENSLVQVNGEYRAVLSQMEGTLHHHVNKAVSWYIRWLRRQGRLPEEEQANGGLDDENS